MIIPGLSPQLQRGVSLVPPLPKDNEVSDSSEANPLREVCVEFTSLQYTASGTTDTAGNLAYHVQEPDPSEGMMTKLKKKKGRRKKKKQRRKSGGKKADKNLGIPVAVHMKPISLKSQKTPIFLPLVSTSERPMKVPFVSQTSVCCAKLWNNWYVVRMPHSQQRSEQRSNVNAEVAGITVHRCTTPTLLAFDVLYGKKEKKKKERGPKCYPGKWNRTEPIASCPRATQETICNYCRQLCEEAIPPPVRKAGRFKISVPRLVAVIMALHIKMSPWPRRQTEAWPPHYHLQAWFPMSGSDPEWIFNPKLTMPHIAYSVQVKSSLHRPIILGQVGSVTWITGKIMR